MIRVTLQETFCYEEQFFEDLGIDPNEEYVEELARFIVRRSPDVLNATVEHIDESEIEGGDDGDSEHDGQEAATVTIDD